MMEGPEEAPRMSTIFTILAAVFMVAVALVLVMGLRNMMIGGPGNTSQKLMRARVMLQAIAVVIIVGAIYFSR
jgi:hypothetical protein